MSKSVTVFSSNTCGYCTMAKDYLSENGVAFTEKNVSTDLEARKGNLQEMRRGSAKPMTTVS